MQGSYLSISAISWALLGPSPYFQLRFDGLLFAHQDRFSHRKYESRVMVAQQLLDYLMEINIA